MRTTELVDNEVRSPSINDWLEVTAWRDGQQLTGPLPISDYQLAWSAARQVQGQASFVVADPDGDLWPRTITDGLAPGGSRLQVAYRFGATGTIIPLGWWRIRESEPDIGWQYRLVGGRWMWLPLGGTVAIQADEETVSLALDRLDVDERRSQAGTVLTEVARLCDPYLPVVVTDVADGPLTARQYDSEDRLTVIQSLLDRIDATYRLSGLGELEIYPAVGTPSGWTIEPGDGGTLIRLTNSMSDSDLINGVTSHVTIQDAAGSETTYISKARLESGPLRWGGPFGRVPYFRGANLAQSQSDVDEDATTTLARHTAEGDVTLNLETVAHPGLQLGDLVNLQAPQWPEPILMPARVTAMTLTGRDGVAVKSMTLKVATPHKYLNPPKPKEIKP